MRREEMAEQSRRPVGGALPVVFHEGYEVDIGPHVFPTAKYRLVRDRLARDGLLEIESLSRPEPASDEDLRLVHTARWVEKLGSGSLSLRDEMLLELPYSVPLREAAWLTCGGAILTARLALREGIAVHIGGGYHHAFPGHGEGFCPLNDVAVATRVLQGRGEIESALVVDLDVHHGNGTAAIFADDPTVFTFSMHQRNNYPFPKPPGDLDLGLGDGTRDEEYLSLLARHLPSILDRAKPDFAYYLAGADPFLEDQLGGLELTLSGLRRRDELVLNELANHDVPVAVCLAGGYARDTKDTVSIHCATVEVGRQVWLRLESAGGTARQAGEQA
jgi:acetoin utilization deacetylase AcuC-like enzyme